MGDETRRPDEAESKWRRFRVTRKVKERPVETEAEKALREAEEDDALRGTPEMDREVRRGCKGCVNVTGLILLIFLLTILGNCALRNM